MPKCRQCGADVAATATFCSRCGARALAHSPAPNPSARASTPAPTKICPQCGAENLAAAKYCRKDAYRFETPLAFDGAPNRENDSDVVCSVCGFRNPAGARFCKKDGAPLLFEATDVPGLDPVTVPGVRAPQEAFPGSGAAERKTAPAHLRRGSETRQSGARSMLTKGVVAAILLGLASLGYRYWGM